MDFKGDQAFAISFQAADKLAQVDTTDPTKEVIGNDSSLATLMQSFVNAQAQTNHNLINFLGLQTAQADGNITVNGQELTPGQQTEYLKNIATKQNVLSRQLERSLQVQINGQLGIQSSSQVHLIHPPPTEWGRESKVSDSGLKLLMDFSGDTNQNEGNLGQFLRAIYALANTATLTEQATISIILRKLSGSAHELAEQFVITCGGQEEIQVKQLVNFLEKKFLIHCSPLAAETKLHELKQGSMTYSQLQASVQKWARLATRLEGIDQRDAITRVKENSSFLMAISSTDRQLVHGENARRTLHNLTPMSLDQMVDFLLSFHADKLSGDRGQINTAGGEDTATQGVCQVQNYKPRGETNRRQYQVPGQRQDFSHTKQRNAGGQKHDFPPKNNRDRPFVTVEMAGVQQGECLLCGDKNHGFKSDKCVYYGTDLMNSKCRHCQRGAHKHSICAKTQVKKPGQPAWPRTGRF